MNYTIISLALLAAAVVLVPLFRFLKLGGVLGYIAAGILIGPHVLGVVKNPSEMAHAAELGVTLLMFLVGLELQPSRLLALRREIFGLGFAQVVGCSALFGLGAWGLGSSPNAAWIIGAGIAMSSTAFIIPMLTDAKALEMRYGKEAVAVCIFQDLAVIPILLAIGLLAADSGSGNVKMPGWNALFALTFIAVFGRRTLGAMFSFAAKFGNNEVFTAMALFITLLISAGLDATGLSASLGAFIGGVLLADSPFKHKLEASLAPFEGLLLGLFFMTVGMGVNLGLFWMQPLLPLALGLIIVVGKALVIFLLRNRLAKIMLQPKCDYQTGLRLCLTLAVGGEFAFVLFQAALLSGVLSASTVDLLTLAIVCSMLIAPICILILNQALAKASAPAARAFDHIDESSPSVVIAGFGRVGQIVGRILNAQKIPFTALDASADHVDFVRKFGNKIYYGDASELSLLEAAQLSSARLFVLAVDDVETSLTIGKLVQHHYPNVTIIARARNRNHLLHLRALGINNVVRETWLDSIELGKRALSNLGVSDSESESFLKRFAEHDAAMLDKQQAVIGKDWEAMIQVSFNARAELEHLLASDASTVNPSTRIQVPK